MGVPVAPPKEEWFPVSTTRTRGDMCLYYQTYGPQHEWEKGFYLVRLVEPDAMSWGIWIAECVFDGSRTRVNANSMLGPALNPMETLAWAAA